MRAIIEMRMTPRRILACTFVALSVSCAHSPAAPTEQSANTPPPPAPASTLTGTWSGTGADSQGMTTVTWTLTQTGESVSGTVRTQAVDPTDGSCNSCHRNKSGTVTGMMSGTSVSLRMFFAAGADGDPTPICSQTLDGIAARSDAGRIVGTYSGADTCEGQLANGTLAMNLVIR
ncbi:MAG TPA: hypothetical protein VGJ29_00405 [Vicinamibacterales bacterium]|jgi:hypothetical protein